MRIEGGDRYGSTHLCTNRHSEDYAGNVVGLRASYWPQATIKSSMVEIVDVNRSEWARGKQLALRTQPENLDGARNAMSKYFQVTDVDEERALSYRK